MKCLHCGRETEEYLCSECRAKEVLAEVFNALLYFKPEVCENPYINAYATALPDGTTLRDIIPQLLGLFPVRMTEYFSCLYAKAIRDPRFEEMALAYLAAHDLAEEDARRILRRSIGTIYEPTHIT